MKMEFLRASDSCPLIRLFDYGPGEVDQLRLACLELAYGRITEFVLHEQPWCKTIGGCRLIWRASSKDLGIRLPVNGDAFVLEHSKEAWLEIETKLWPFSERSGGYNWLTMEGDVNLLISWNGSW